MRTRALLSAVLFLLPVSCMNNKEKMNPPVAEKRSKELTNLGHTRIDNYYWLNDRDNPEVIEYLKAENDYTDAVMKKTEKFQEELYDEIVSRIKQTDESVPYLDNGYYYYNRFEEGKEYPVYCRKKESLEAEEEILLNVNEMAEGYDFYNVAGFTVSPDNNKIAFGVDTLSRRKYTIYFKNLLSGEVLKESIPVTTGRAYWANDNKTVFYTTKDDETLRPDKIWKHRLGTSSEQDVMVYFEEDETFNTSVFRTKSNAYLIIASGSTLSDEYRFMDANTPDGEFRIIQPRERGLEYEVDHFRDKFYIRTNLDAINFRLMETPVTATTRENWKEVIPHREDVYLRGIEIFNDYLVVAERKDGLINLRIKKWQDDTEYYLDFGEEVYVAGISVNRQFDSKWLRYSYTSLTTPNSTYDFNMETKEKKLLKQQEVVGDFDSANYETKRLYALASDGVKVPISLVYRKGITLDGSNPLLLYGYGSYGYTIDPYFSSDRLSLIDRGFVYAIAHIRGGQIYGRQCAEKDEYLYRL